MEVDGEPTPEQLAAFRVALIAMAHAARDMRTALDTMGSAMKDMGDCMAWINKRQRSRVADIPWEAYEGQDARESEGNNACG